MIKNFNEESKFFYLKCKDSMEKISVKNKKFKSKKLFTISRAEELIKVNKLIELKERVL